MGRGVAALSLPQRQHINMSSSNWRDGEIQEADRHGSEGDACAFNDDGKDGSIYEKVPEVLSLRGICRDKKKVVSKIKNMSMFLHL